MCPADARYPSATSMSVLIPGTIWILRPLPARLMPQPSLRTKPAAFQTTAPLPVRASAFLLGVWTFCKTIRAAMAATATTNATTFTGVQGRLPGRWLAGGGVAGGGVLAACGVRGGGGGGGFGAGAGGPAGAPGFRDS